MLQKLFSIITMLEDAHKILQMPELLQSELSYGSKKYLEQLVKSTKIQKTAHDQLDKTHMAMSKLGPTLNAMKVWPQNIEHASESAINAVKQVHSKLLTELAQAGPTQTRLAQVISQLDLKIPKQLEKLTSEKHAYIEPTIAQKTLTPREYEEKIPFTKLQEEVAVLVSESKATLNKLKSNIAKAREISKQLEKISEKHLKVLENATELFDKKTRTLNSTIEKYSSDLSKTLRLLTEAEQVIDQVDFIKINLEIESCVKLSQISY
jgi:hypothetical protein